MALIVGNLLVDPDANSFMSAEDADSFLLAEGVAAWAAAAADAKEPALIRASRWMAVSLRWCRKNMTADELALIGKVAARVAVHALTVDLWAAESVGKDAKRYKAGSVEVEYQDRRAVSGPVAAGKRFPWLLPMLGGLVCSGAARWIDRV